jgi:predicted secreted acid phosphatase
MASCFEVAMALTEAGYIQDKDLDSVTTILVETLLATGTIKERSQAVEDRAVDEEIYAAAEYAAAAEDARGNYDDEIHQAEIMLEAKERQMAHEAIIIDADEVIKENARLAIETLVEKGLVKDASADRAEKLIAQAWSSSGK